MFRKRTRLTSRVWTVVFLLLFNDALAQTTIATIAKISPLEDSSKTPPSNRTVLRKIVVEDSNTKATLANDEKQEPIIVNSTNSPGQIERTSTREPLKQKDSKKSIIEEKIKAVEEPAVSTAATIDSLNRTTLVERILKSQPSENNVSRKPPKLIPDEESLPKLPRNKSKPIFLDAFKESSKHNVKKSDTVVTPESEGSDDKEIEEHELEHKEPTSIPTTKNKDSMKGLENFDVEPSKNDQENEKEDKNSDKDETFKEEATREEPVSLANDTKVNFNHVNKSQTLINNTNIISENDDATEVDFSPKHQVEIVKNVTLPPIMRLVQAPEVKNEEPVDSDKSNSDTRKKLLEQINDKNSTKIDDNENSESAPSVNDVDLKNDKVKLDISKTDIPLSKMDIPLSKTETPPVTTEVSKSKADIPPSSINKTIENASWIEGLPRRKDIFEKKESTETSLASEKKNLNESVSPSPRARTISFSGINEFIPENVDSKIALSKTTNNESPLTKRPFLSDKQIEQRPYPYLKIETKKPIDETEDISKESSFSKKIEQSTEEVLAYENTIGRRESDKKLVITEPSVVIENSIQQFKPTYYKRSGNATRINSTLSDFGLRTTTSKNDEEKNMTSTTERSIPLSSTMLAASADEITLTPEENQLDLNANAITEVNSKNVSSNDFVKGTSSTLTEKVTKIEKTLKEDVTERTAEKTKVEENSPETTKSSEDSKIDLQTSAEDSKFSFSHMNATESSTEHPVMKKVEEKKQTESSLWTSTSTTMETLATTEKALPTTTEILKNSSKSEESQNSTTQSSVEQPETTTSVEYEFVGLKETTTPGQDNGLPDSDISATMLSPLHDETTESSSETSTFVPRTFDQEETTTEAQDQITTSEPVTESSSFKSTKENSTEDKFTDEKYTTIGPETLQPDETSFFTSTTASDQDSIVPVSETSLGNDSTTVDDLSSIDSDTFKKNATTSTTEMTVDSKVPTTSETSHDMTTVTEPSVAMDTTAMPTSTYTPTTEYVSISTENTISKFTTEISADAPPSLSSEDIKVLVRIVFEGTWNDVCPHLPFLREKLADLLTASTEKAISPRQVIFHQTQCTEDVSMASSSETPLTSVLIYVIDERGGFDETMTKMLPSLYKVSTIAFPLPVHSFLLVQEADSGNAIAVVVVSSVAFICLVLLAGLLFIMRKRQTRFNYGERCRPVSLDAYSLDSVSAYNSSVRRKGAIRASKRSYGNPTFEDSRI
ncbi:flocculation protein FLO11 isoform X2 [Belonocnema kinseyi]|uniref:flocculation protein FLO11 isoform X2 n=1 Tax=Belonocnema kinseyi TaxID=2817044 RepID=UPI00143D9CD8|nr:flocculation protein FLO11 isoform X2 [Belonocnema kinseyi]